MKHNLILMIIISLCFFAVSCKKEEAVEKEFMEKLSEAKSYLAEGVMESYYQEGRRQNEFNVKYQEPDCIKVTINDKDNNDKQIILKNNDGVYILVPSVNKNFKIQSNWPTNSSYPYLLQSLAKDIANETNPIITEEDESYTIETNTSLHNDAIAVKQKIIFDKETTKPKEVLVYDSNGNLYIRVLFTKIELNNSIEENEFSVEKSMETSRLEYKEEKVVYDRDISYPVIYPEGASLIGEDTVTSDNGEEVRTIMKYTGDVGFTIIQEYINEKEVTVFQQEVGEITTVLGNVAIIKENGVQMFYQGVEYTVGSNDLAVMQMLEILAGYMVNTSK